MSRRALLLAVTLGACAGPSQDPSATDADACAADQARRGIGPSSRSDAIPRPACRLRLPLFLFR
jgi:hypothetical protein